MVLVDETTLVCISTANENPTAHYQALVNRKDERNEEFLRTFTFTNICSKCAAIGLKTCKHDASVLTAWTSRRKKNLTKALIGDESGDYDREILGLNIQGSNAVFPVDKIGMMFASTERELRGEQIEGVIFVTIDPNTGQYDRGTEAQSKFAIVTLIEAPGRGVSILGMESIPGCNPSDWTPYLIEHLRQIRTNESTKTRPIVFMIESNLGQMADMILAEIVRAGILNIHCYSPDEVRAGVRTTHPIKENMYVKTIELLNRDRIDFVHPFISIHQPKEKVKAELKAQMLQYSRIRKAGTDPAQPPSVSYTGKLSKTTCDDLCVSLQLGIYWRDRFWLDTDPRLEKYKKAPVYYQVH